MVRQRSLQNGNSGSLFSTSLRQIGQRRLRSAFLGMVDKLSVVSCRLLVLKGHALRRDQKALLCEQSHQGTTSVVPIRFLNKLSSRDDFSRRGICFCVV